MDMFVSDNWSRTAPIYFEHEGNCAIRRDNKKLVCQYGGDWELYDMDEDRTELTNLASKDGKRVQEMAKQYSEWAEGTGVLDWREISPVLLWHMIYSGTTLHLELWSTCKHLELCSALQTE